MPATTPITLLASSAQSSSGTGASVDLGIATTAALTLGVSAASGSTPTLDVSIETSPDGVSWRTLDAFGSVSTTGVTSKSFPGADRYVRANWVIAGTSFTFSVTGLAVVVYATPADLYRHGAPEESFAAIPLESQEEGLEAQSEEADAWLAAAYTLPLVAWSKDLRKYVAILTTYDLFVTRGLNPEGSDEMLIKRHDDAIAWFKRIANGTISPPGIIDSTPDIDEGHPFAIASDPPRRWRI